MILSGLIAALVAFILVKLNQYNSYSYLIEEPREVISYGQMIKELGELCDEHYEENRTCRGCECFGRDGLCDRNKLANDKFTITRK